MDKRGGGAVPASEAPEKRAPSAPVEESAADAELVPRRSRGELNALAKSAYQGDCVALVALGSLSPSEKHYLATREEFQHFIIALMFDAVIGNERVTKSQRAAAAWFHRVIKDHSEGEKERKRGRIPDEAEVVDAGGGE